jgi:LPXTG-motif cell wall-anchored protein
MLTRQKVLRVAAASIGTVVMTMSATGPAYAEAGGNGRIGSEHGASQSAPGQSTAEQQRDDENAIPPRSTEADSAAEHAAEPAQGVGDEPATGPDHSQGNASTEGEAIEPQPESTADKNDGGANAGTCAAGTAGPYCSTRDGSVSDNGNGGGEETGRPCAGCVGKADNKNPQGQLPDAERDGNRGYECDTPGHHVPNNGIAEGNPAHTGCTTGALPSPVAECPGGDMNGPRPGCADEPNRPGEPGQPNTPGQPGEPAMPGTPDEPGKPDQPNVPGTPEIAGEEAERPTALTPSAFVEEQRDEVAGVQLTANRAPVVVAASTGALPETGAGDHAGIATVAGAALMAGGVLLLRRRQQLSH